MPMKLKLNNFIKFCYLLLLVSYIVLYPTYADTNADASANKLVSEVVSRIDAKNKKEKEDSTTTSNTQKTTIDSFFRDATYEKFESQEKSEDSPPFDKSYLEGQ